MVDLDILYLSATRFGIYTFIIFEYSNYSLSISPSSGLDYEPDYTKHPYFSNILLFFNSIRYLTKGEMRYYFVLYFFKLNSTDC